MKPNESPMKRNHEEKYANRPGSTLSSQKNRKSVASESKDRTRRQSQASSNVLQQNH